MELTNFHGGVWIAPFFGAQIPSNGLLVADNVEIVPEGGLKGRRGRSLYGTLPAKVISLWRHYPRTGSPATLAAFDNGSVVEIRHDTASTGTFGACSGGAVGFTTGARFSFTNWASKDRSFFSNGHGLWSYNGVITPVVQTGTQITGPYVVVHQSRLFGTKLSEINYSVYATDVNDEVTVSGGNQLNVSDPQGGSITGLVSLPDRLCIFKSTSLWVSLGDIRYNAILTKLSEIGCVAPWTIAQTQYGVIFLGRDGLYLTDGQNPIPRYLSKPIEQLFNSSTANAVYPNAVGVWYARKDQYVLKLDPAHPYVFVLQRLQIPGEKQALWVWTRNTDWPLVTGHTWDSEIDSGEYFVSDASGSIFRADTGTTDAGVAYTPVVQTAFLRLSEEQRVGRVHYAYLTYQGSSAALVGFRYNNHGANDVTLTLGAAQALGVQRARRKVDDQTKSGQFVSTVVVLPQDSAGAELYALRLDVRLRSSRVWR